MKINFKHQGKEYYMFCRSFEYHNEISWFYTNNDVKYIRGKISIISVYASETAKELMGYTNYTKWL